MSSFVPFDDARTLLLAANLVGPALIEWPNEPFDEPSTDPAQQWFSVENTGRVLAPVELGTGGGVWAEEGTLYVHVLTPRGRGTDAARVLAKAVANVYRGLGPRNVIYRSASIGDGLMNDRGGLWWALTVSVDWNYQDINT